MLNIRWDIDYKHPLRPSGCEANVVLVTHEPLHMDIWWCAGIASSSVSSLNRKTHIMDGVVAQGKMKARAACQYGQRVTTFDFVNFSHVLACSGRCYHFG